MSGRGTLEVVISIYALYAILLLMKVNSDIARIGMSYFLVFIGLIIISLAMGARIIIRIKK